MVAAEATAPKASVAVRPEAEQSLIADCDFPLTGPLTRCWRYLLIVATGTNEGDLRVGVMV